MGSNDEAVDVVRRFCAAWGVGDYAALGAYFTEGATYHNIPMDPIVGRQPIVDFIQSFMSGVGSVEFRIRNIVASGPVVMTERVDVFTTGDQKISLPVMGVFELEGSLISAWRDYFDLNQYMSQLSAPS